MFLNFFGFKMSILQFVVTVLLIAQLSLFFHGSRFWRNKGFNSIILNGDIFFFVSIIVLGIGIPYLINQYKKNYDD